jgi:ribonuclease BN (tRNA processing enzyme)
VRLEILGTRGNIPVSAPGYARHPGVLIDARILLDLGEAAYLRRRPTHIFITHLHPDHAIHLPNVATGARVYVPERISRTVRIGSYRITPVPTVHSLKLRSVGYVVQKGKRRVFYSSDLVSIDRQYYRRLRRLDLVITDGSYIRRGGLVRINPATGRRFGHAGIPDLIAFFRAFTRRIVITHFGSWFYKDIAASIRRIADLGDGVEVSAARDGLVIDL